MSSEQQRIEQEIARLQEQLARLTVIQPLPVQSEPSTPTSTSDNDWSIVDDTHVPADEVKSELFSPVEARTYLDLVHTELKKRYPACARWTIESDKDAIQACLEAKGLTRSDIDVSKMDFLVSNRGESGLPSYCYWVFVQCSRTRVGLFSYDNSLCVQTQNMLTKRISSKSFAIVVQRWYPDRILSLSVDRVPIVDMHLPFQPVHIEGLFRRFPEKKEQGESPSSTVTAVSPISFTDDEFQVYLHDIVYPLLKQKYPSSKFYFYRTSIAEQLLNAGLGPYMSSGRDVDMIIVDSSCNYYLIQCSVNKVGKPSFKGDLPKQVDSHRKYSASRNVIVQRWYPDEQPDSVVQDCVEHVHAPFVVPKSDDKPGDNPNMKKLHALLEQMYIQGRIQWRTNFENLENVRTFVGEQVFSRAPKIHFIRCEQAQQYIITLNLRRVSHELSMQIDVVSIDALNIAGWTSQTARKHMFVLMTKDLSVGQRKFIHSEHVGFLHDNLSRISHSFIGLLCGENGKSLSHVLYTDVNQVVEFLTTMSME
jgi:hypothetical protein